MFKNTIEEFENFLSKHPILILLRVLFLIISLLLYVWMKNFFSAFLVWVALLSFFLEIILKILNLIIDLLVGISEWKNANKLDIQRIIEFMGFEILSFFINLIASAMITIAILQFSDLKIDILNSRSASYIAYLLVFTLILLTSNFIVTYFVQKIYFRYNLNKLGFTMLDSVLKFFESIIIVCILGFNGIVYEYIEIHKDIFIPIFNNYGIIEAEAAVSAKGIYSLFVYGSLFAISAFHIAFRKAYFSSLNNKQLEQERLDIK